MKKCYFTILAIAFAGLLFADGTGTEPMPPEQVYEECTIDFQCPDNLVCAFYDTLGDVPICYDREKICEPCLSDCEVLGENEGVPAEYLKVQCESGTVDPGETPITCSNDAGKCSVTSTGGSCECFGSDVGTGWAGAPTDGEPMPPATMEDCTSALARECGTEAPVTCKNEAGNCSITSRGVNCDCLISDGSVTSVDGGSSNGGTSSDGYDDGIIVTADECNKQLVANCGEKLPDLKASCGQYLEKCADVLFTISNACSEEIGMKPLTAEEKAKLVNGEWVAGFESEVYQCCYSYNNPVEYPDNEPGQTEPGDPAEPPVEITDDQMLPSDNEVVSNETTPSDNPPAILFAETYDPYKEFLTCLEENNNDCSKCISENEPVSGNPEDKGSDGTYSEEDTQTPPTESPDNTSAETGATDNSKSDTTKKSSDSGCSMILA